MMNIVAAMTCVVAAVAAIAADGRRHRRPAMIYTIRNKTWQGVEACSNDGWYRRNLRVSRATFNWIVDQLTEYSGNNGIALPGDNAYVDMRTRIALTLSYLSQEDGFIKSAALFGIAKSTAIKNVNSCLDVLVSLAPQVIKFPSTPAAWQKIAGMFEENCGFPDVAGAIDGTLLQIERPFEYDGWICRKGFPAINMQATVDADGRFMEYSIRSESCSDKNVWTMSRLGQLAPGILPVNMHFLGDAGYTLSPLMLTPYLIYECMPQDEKRYNYLHSRTWIVVERAFGGLKGRWRILKRTLNMKSPMSCARTIVACMIVHNLTVDAGDGVDLGNRIDLHQHQRFDNVEGHRRHDIDRQQKRNNIKDYFQTLN